MITAGTEAKRVTLIGAVARMERSVIRDCREASMPPGFRSAPSGLRLLLTVCGTHERAICACSIEAPRMSVLLGPRLGLLDFYLVTFVSIALKASQPDVVLLRASAFGNRNFVIKFDFVV